MPLNVRELESREFSSGRIRRLQIAQVPSPRFLPCSHPPAPPNAGKARPSLVDTHAQRTATGDKVGA